MKKLICIALCLVVLISTSLLSVYASTTPHFYGDVNNNHDVEITDVTEIQRSLANLIELSDLCRDLADVDADGKVSVLDATMIQMKLAHIIPSFNHNDYGLYTDVHFDNITADFNSGKAIAGVPVTFRVVASSRDGEPLRYLLRVNGVDVAENEESVLIYTFDEAGLYDIEVYVLNKYNEEFLYHFTYSVIEKADDNIIISAVNKNHFYLNENDDIVVTANAFGGTAPYEYSFKLKGNSLTQDYSESNSFAIGKLPIGIYEVEISVRDANGNIANEVYAFEVEEIVVG